jgi:hypothetical protein
VKIFFLGIHDVELSFFSSANELPSALNLMQVPTDDDPNWNLDKVEVSVPESTDIATFNYGNWLDCDNPSTDVSRWRSNIDYL